MKKSQNQDELDQEEWDDEQEMKEFEEMGIKMFTQMGEFYSKFVFPNTPDGIIDKEEYENEFLIELTEERKQFFISKYKKYYNKER